MFTALILICLITIGAGTLPISAVEAVQSTCDDLHHCRTIWNIIWSCVVTIPACTWVTVHPNVLAQDENKFTIVLRRVKIVLFALVMPELIIMWAVRQWLIARALGRRVRQIMKKPRRKTCKTKNGKGVFLCSLPNNIFY